MPKLPAISPKKVLKALGRAGFYIDHATGAHQALRHPTKTHLRITVSLHSSDLSPKTLKSILKQAELSVEEFIEIL